MAQKIDSKGASESITGCENQDRERRRLRLGTATAIGKGITYAAASYVVAERWILNNGFDECRNALYRMREEIRNRTRQRHYEFRASSDQRMRGFPNWSIRIGSSTKTKSPHFRPSMEISQPPMAVSTDSFSQNWLLDTSPAFEFSYTRSDSDTAGDEDSMSLDSFQFGHQFPALCCNKVDDVFADELFLNGFIKSTIAVAAPLPEGPSSDRQCLFDVNHQLELNEVADLRCSLLRKWSKQSEKMVTRCWKVFKQLVGGRVGWRKSTKVTDLELNNMFERYRTASSGTYKGSCENWSTDNPIYEAVLHCKRSFGL